MDSLCPSVDYMAGMRGKICGEHWLRDGVPGRSSKVGLFIAKYAVSDPAPPATLAIPTTDQRSGGATVAGIATIATPSDVEFQLSKFTPAQSAVPD